MDRSGFTNVVESPTRASARPIRLMIVGAPKAGTTSLKEYLGQHPDFRTHDQREMIFFVNRERYAQGYERVFPFYFPGEPRGPVLVAKGVAMMYSAVALRRLREHNPDVHIVLMLREPAARAYSDFWFARRHGLEELETFEAAIERECTREYEPLKGLPATAYLERGRYLPYVEHLLSEFAAGRTHIFLFDDLRRDAAAICGRIFGLFDDVDHEFRPSVDVRHNPTAVPRSRGVVRLLRERKPDALRKALHRVLGARRAERLKAWLLSLNERAVRTPPMSNATRRRLREHFRPLNERLARRIDRDLDVWH